MSDPQSKDQNFQQNIDDPAMYLNLDSHHQESRQRRGQSVSNDDQYVPEPVDEEQNKNQDIELYQPQSNNLDEEEQEKQNDELPHESEVERPIQMAIQSLPSEVLNGLQLKSQMKKRKKTKKKELDSQQDEYSGQYSSRKKSKGKDIKKGGKKSQSGRGRGKPRGRGSSSKLRQIKMPTYPQDRKAEKELQKKKPQALLKKPSVSFNSNWKVGGQFQQDWDSSNAQIYSQSIHRRFQCPVNIQILNLIQNHHQRPQDIIQLIKKLPLVCYTTIN